MLEDMIKHHVPMKRSHANEGNIFSIGDQEGTKWSNFILFCILRLSLQILLEIHVICPNISLLEIRQIVG